jgi:hypothetical protein
MVNYYTLYTIVFNWYYQFSSVQISSNQFRPFFGGFFAVSVQFFEFYHIRQPVAVVIASKKREKPDWTGLLNASHSQWLCFQLTKNQVPTAEKMM